MVGMKNQWKTLENSRRISVGPKMLGWIRDKDNRSMLAWLSSLLGIGFVMGYQITLGEGFTPNVNLGEGAFVLGKSAFIGLILFLAMYIGVFAPASSLRLLEIDVDTVKGLPRIETVKAVIRRCVAAQIFGGFFPAAIIFFEDASAPFHLWIGVGYSVLSVAAISVALSSQRLPSESSIYFYFSIFIIGIFALFSLALFVIIANLKDEPESIVLVSFAWLGLTFISGILSIVRRRELVPSGVAAMLLLACVLASLGQLRWPFRAIANVVGIAQPGRVTLVVPDKSCVQVKSALQGIEDVNCVGSGIGVLKNVEVLNSWGTRWLIRIDNGVSSRTISFDGSGTVIVDEKKITKAGKEQNRTAEH